MATRLRFHGGIGGWVIYVDLNELDLVYPERGHEKVTQKVFQLRLGALLKKDPTSKSRPVLLPIGFPT